MTAARFDNEAAPITPEMSPALTFTLTQTVGDRIRWARERKELTQKELAKYVGKSRAAVVQYEMGRIAAPLSVVNQLANVLDVPPEFLAFGRTGLPGVANAQEDVTVLEEITRGRDGLYTSGGWGMPSNVLSGHRDSIKKVKAINLTLDEPFFDMKTGDRVFVDTAATIEKDGFYVIETVFGHRVVRIKTGFTGALRIVHGVDGTEEVLDSDSLPVVGLVVATFRHLY
jgi:transcriptional regulator with XRE-family HTH domain